MYERGREGARRPPTCWLRGRRSNPQMWASLNQAGQRASSRNRNSQLRWTSQGVVFTCIS
jgi:hypothetical protein